MKIGVLAVQGNFREHAAMLRRLGAEPVEVRKPEQLEGLDGLIIPGGESTAIMRLVRLYGLEDAIRRFARPVFGTCAGMILLDRNHLGVLDLEVARNAYGRQVASFEADLDLEGDAAPLRGVFIRAPRVREAGSDVEVLAVEQDHARARAEHRAAEAPDRLLEAVQPHEPRDRRRLAARDDEAVEPVELLREPHLDRLGAEAAQDGRVLAKVPLQGEDADGRSGALHGLMVARPTTASA